MTYRFGTICACGGVLPVVLAQSPGDGTSMEGVGCSVSCGGEANMLRILIADDHEVARRGIRSLLEAHPGWEVCGEAKDGREAVELATRTKPDVFLLDIGMPNLNGLDAARQILATDPDARILILTVHESEQVVREVLAAGARGFLLKSDAGRDLLAAVEALQQRRTFFTPKVAQMMLDGYLRPKDQSDLG